MHSVIPSPSLSIFSFQLQLFLRVKRRIKGSNAGYDFNLNGTFFLLHGISLGTPMADSLVSHQGGFNPTVEIPSVNLVDSLMLYSGAAYPDNYILLLVVASLLTLVVNI